jgi:hypothetical protein
MARRGIPFAAMTLAQAHMLAKRIPQHANGVRMHGEWRQRRFVIAMLSHPAAHVQQTQANIGAAELDLPMGLEPERIVAEARRFGMRVEWLRRQLKLFEIEEGSDGVTHIVHAFHHVATCGYRGPWPQGVSTPRAPTCQHCLLEAAIRPVFRARYHPALGV